MAAILVTFLSAEYVRQVEVELEGHTAYRIKGLKGKEIRAKDAGDSEAHRHGVLRLGDAVGADLVDDGRKVSVECPLNPLLILGLFGIPTSLYELWSN
jgi:hypothetical protein